jgi:hypothetical protein
MSDRETLNKNLNRNVLVLPAFEFRNERRNHLMKSTSRRQFFDTHGKIRARSIQAIFLEPPGTGTTVYVTFTVENHDQLYGQYYVRRS